VGECSPQELKFVDLFGQVHVPNDDDADMPMLFLSIVVSMFL